MQAKSNIVTTGGLVSPTYIAGQYIAIYSYAYVPTYGMLFTQSEIAPRKTLALANFFKDGSYGWFTGILLAYMQRKEAHTRIYTCSSTILHDRRPHYNSPIKICIASHAHKGRSSRDREVGGFRSGLNNPLVEGSKQAPTHASTGIICVSACRTDSTQQTPGYAQLQEIKGLFFSFSYTVVRPFVCLLYMAMTGYRTM